MNNDLNISSFNSNRLTTGVTFDASGNITWKEGIGYYTYHPVKRHAVIDVTYYQNIGNAHSITYTPFQKVSGILCHSTGFLASFTYGPTHLRREMTALLGNHTLIRHYTQNVDISVIKNSNGDTIARETKEYIFSPFGLVAIRNNGLVNAVATDHLGSIVAEFNRQRNTFEYFGYTAWGRRYRYDSAAGDKFFFDENLPHARALFHSPATILDYFQRGFTGHEHLDLFGLINMNGRLYDPIIARFLSPDPFVQAPMFSQNFNRFSYVWNNPLRFIDPSGYIVENIDSWTTTCPIAINTWLHWLTGNPGASIGSVFSFVQRQVSSFVDPFGGGSGWLFSLPPVEVVGMRGGNWRVNANSMERAVSQRDAILSQIHFGQRNNWSDDFLRRMENPLVQHMHRGGEAFWEHPVTQIATAMLPMGGFVRGGALVSRGTHTVYQGINRTTGMVQYVGITGRNPAIRFAEHARSGTNLMYRPISGATGLTKTQARIWEQRLINQLGLQKNGGQLLNQRNSIAPQHWWRHGITP